MREHPTRSHALPRPGWLRYAVAVALVALAWLLREALTPQLGPTALPFITFFPAVAAAAWIGGLGAGALAMLLSVLVANWSFLAPVHTLNLPSGRDVFVLVTFLIASGFIVAAIECMHRARARLQQASHLLVTTLTSIGDAVIVTDQHGRVTFLNPEAQRLCGCGDEVLGRPLAEVFRIVNERTRQPVDNPVDRVLQTGKVVGLANHTLLLGHHGLESPIDDSAAPVRDGDGPISGVVLVFRDVTQQRAAQQAVAQLAAVVRYSGDAIVTKDLDGVIRTWNASAQRLFGYTAEEAVGRSITMLIPEDHRDEEPRILARLRQGLACERLETVRRTKDGRLLHVSLSISPLKDADGNVIGASKVVQDISDAVLARQELARERELLATTLASIGDAVIVTDQDGKVTFLNSEAERLTGWQQVEAQGRPLPEVFRIVDGQSRDPVENPVDRVMRSGQVVGLANHTLLIARHGGETPIDDSAAPIVQPGGRQFGVVLVFRDISERRRAEAELRQADRRKDEFLAVLSHELRNPLAPIRLAVAMLQDPGTPPPERRQLVEVIARQTLQLTRLLDDLLDVGRITSGKIVLQPERIDVRVALADGLEASRPLIDACGHQLSVQQPPQPVEVDADRARLSQVFANLLNNAARYTDKGGRIDVEIGSDGGRAIVRVRDNGVGIAAEQLPRLFELFAQGEQPAGHGRGGLGVGLALARRLVELHGGSIEAHSRGRGNGSEFTVALPLAGRPEPAPVPAPRSGLPPALQPLRVVVADDNADSALLLATMLRQLGHEVSTAMNGKEALAATRRVLPDVAILDLGMPGLDGLEVARRIRSEVPRPVALIALTGWGQEEDLRRAREAGFDHHLTKPVELATLLRLLAEVRPARTAD